MNGYTWLERRTQKQINAAAETLWDFAWNSDPNDPPPAWTKFFKGAGHVAQEHYREWARAILAAAETGDPQHAWFKSSHERHTKDDNAAS